MIKFFRRIRQRLLSENRLGKYLIYALGEIVLVVIGILANLFPIWTLLSLLSCPVAHRLCRTIQNNYHHPQKLLTCRLIAVEMHFWLGCFFGFGFLLPSLTL